MLSKQLTNDIASKILSTVDDHGWRTQITDDAGFNRSRFHLDYIKELSLHQLVRLFVAIAYKQGSKFQRWWREIGDAILDLASDSEAYYDKP
jgi:hypothetical protein